MHISVLFKDLSTHQSPTLDYMNKPMYFEAVPLRTDIGSYLCTTVSLCPSTETFGARRAFGFGVVEAWRFKPATGQYP